jgi:hypothetical protein
MRKKYHLVVVLAVLFALATEMFAQEKSLAEIYRQGTVRLSKGLVISDESLPEGEFFSNLVSVAVDDSGAVYACDYAANNIKKFNADGEFLRIIGKEGQGPGEFGSPLQIDVVRDRLIVWDSMNMRISLLSLEGEYIKSIKWDRLQLGWPYRIKSLPEGKIGVEGRISIRRGKSRPDEWIIHLFSYDMDRLREVDRREVWARKNIMNPELQRQQSIPVPFSARIHWDMSPNGNIIIGYSEKYEIEIHDPLKGIISTFTREYEPVEVSKVDREQYFAGMTSSTSVGGAVTRKQGAPEYVVKNTDFPRYKPAFDDILCDSEGNIWVHTFHKDREEEGHLFDAFDENGRFLNRVRIDGEGSYPFRARRMNRAFCVIEEDEDGFQTIAIYRIEG